MALLFDPSKLDMRALLDPVLMGGGRGGFTPPGVPGQAAAAMPAPAQTSPPIANLNAPSPDSAVQKRSPLFGRLGNMLSENSTLLIALGAGFAGAPSFGEGLQRALGNAAAVAAKDDEVRRQERRARTEQQQKDGERQALFRALVQRGVPPKDAVLITTSPEAARLAGIGRQERAEPAPLTGIGRINRAFQRGEISGEQRDALLARETEGRAGPNVMEGIRQKIRDGGIGSLTAGELRVYEDTLRADPVARILSGILDGRATPGGAPSAPLPGQSDDGIPTVSTAQEAEALPPGTIFRTPDGRLKQVPARR